MSRLAPLGETKPAELLRSPPPPKNTATIPTAKALAQLAGEAGVPLAEPRLSRKPPGAVCRPRSTAPKCLVGRAQWLKDNGMTADFEKSVDLNDTEGWSLIFVAHNGQCVGWVGLQDKTRAEARDALVELKEAGVRRIAMVSGDRQPVVARVARRDWLRRGQGRLSAAGQGGLRARREGQGLSGGGHRRRR